MLLFMKGNFTDEVLYHNTQNIIISEVRISPDLKNATAFVYTLGGKNFESILQALNNDRVAFQSYIGKNLNLKFTPKIRFKEDSSFDNAHNIESLLYQINQNKTSEDE